MLTYPISEIFYSIQGEGLWSGTPMHFVRLQGCNLKCPFCDQPASQVVESLNCDEILGVLQSRPQVQHVCITGGEPTIRDLDPLITALRSKNYFIHLETNGTQLLPQSKVDWITVSPKDNTTIWTWRYNEWKFLVGIPGWEALIKNYGDLHSIQYLQPTWGPDLKVNTQKALQYALLHPQFRVSVQLHKILEVR